MRFSSTTKYRESSPAALPEERSYLINGPALSERSFSIDREMVSSSIYLKQLGRYLASQTFTGMPSEASYNHEGTFHCY